MNPRVRVGFLRFTIVELGGDAQGKEGGQSVPKRGKWREELHWGLEGKTFSASAGAGCIGVIEKESFSLKTVGEVEFGSDEVEKAFFIATKGNVVQHKNFVVGGGGIHKIELIR